MILKNGFEDVKNFSDTLNEKKSRNMKNTFFVDYNCMGYATNTFAWACPYDTEQEGEDLFDYGCGNYESNEKAELLTEKMLRDFKGKLRRIKALDEVKEGEHGILFKCGDDDFHFIKYFPESKRFYHKRGSSRIKRISKDEALADTWCSSYRRGKYDSKTIMFAMNDK